MKYARAFEIIGLWIAYPAFILAMLFAPIWWAPIFHWMTR